MIDREAILVDDRYVLAIEIILREKHAAEREPVFVNIGVVKPSACLAMYVES